LETVGEPAEWRGAVPPPAPGKRGAGMILPLRRRELIGFTMHNSDRMVRTGVAIAFAIGLAPQIAVAAPHEPKAEVCGKADGLTLTGKIRSLQSMREEPQAEV
jgi:hypothetical protein